MKTVPAHIGWPWKKWRHNVYSAFGIYNAYKRKKTIEATARYLGIKESEVVEALNKVNKRIERRHKWNKSLDKIPRREPDSLPNALLSTIAVLGFIFFPITLAISFVFSPPKHKKRKF
nr:MAG TPA: hypothetical protein [Caudoviricetes sp.]